jgi:hypothetical protein
MPWTMCSEGRYLLPFCALCFHPYFQRTWSVVLVRLAGLGRTSPKRSSRKFALSCIVGRWSSNSQEVSKKVKKRTYPTQNSSGIHRVLVLMPICSRIRALREKGNPAA